MMLEFRNQGKVWRLESKAPHEPEAAAAALENDLRSRLKAVSAVLL